jgi:hypothetical protein
MENRIDFDWAEGMMRIAYRTIRGGRTESAYWRVLRYDTVEGLWFGSRGEPNKLSILAGGEWISIDTDDPEKTLAQIQKRVEAQLLNPTDKLRGRMPKLP